ncbi:uncharacterized protein LOC119839811 [Zerene cesonia]|uniref:uncharacterized protein LOC119839811 n=1 Tax=Zerene cesonia TaxID=33412 RepID=UPI0018E578F5|nr:uncharacterized protein LOC119839811 [Zerene cesonia]
MAPSLRQNNSQKYYIKLICDILYYCGLGNCWYEEKQGTKLHKYLYKAWSIFANVFGVLIIFNEVLANVRSDLTPKEKNDLMQFTFGHPTISAKVMILYIKKEEIKAFFKRMLDDTRNSVEDIEKYAVKRALFYCLVLISVLSLALFLTVVDAVKAYFVQGIPIRTEVIFYPTSSDTGVFVNILRVFVEIHFWLFIIIMTSIDCLSLCSLVFLGFKFRGVRIYFEKLAEKFNKPSIISEEFESDFITGVQLHEDALWCARNVQQSMGYIYSVQIVESITLLVISLLRLVGAGHANPTLFVVGMTATICLVILTGSYMMDAADVTHEALQISTAIFHCGWENVKVGPGLRTTIVLAIQRSQDPVYLTAFGVIKLSYASFISILRSSYSFFAVMY